MPRGKAAIDSAALLASPRPRPPCGTGADAVLALSLARRAAAAAVGVEKPTQLTRDDADCVDEAQRGCARCVRNRDAAVTRLRPTTPAGCGQRRPSPPCTPRDAAVGGPRRPSSAQPRRASGVRSLSQDPDTSGAQVSRGVVQSDAEVLICTPDAREHLHEALEDFLGLKQPGISDSLTAFVDSLGERFVTMLGTNHPHMEMLRAFLDRRTSDLRSAIVRASLASRALLAWHEAVRQSLLWDHFGQVQSSLISCRRELTCTLDTLEEERRSRTAAEIVAEDCSKRAGCVLHAAEHISAVAQHSGLAHRCLVSWRSRCVSDRLTRARARRVGDARPAKEAAATIRQSFAAWAMAGAAHRSRLAIEGACAEHRADLSRARGSVDAVLHCAARRADDALSVRCLFVWLRTAGGRARRGLAERAESEAEARLAASDAAMAARRFLLRALAAPIADREATWLHVCFAKWVTAWCTGTRERTMCTTEDCRRTAEAGFIRRGTSIAATARSVRARLLTAYCDMCLVQCFTRWAYEHSENCHSRAVSSEIARNQRAIKSARSRRSMILAGWELTSRITFIATMLWTSLVAWRFGAILLREGRLVRQRCGVVASPADMSAVGRQRDISESGAASGTTKPVARGVIRSAAGYPGVSHVGSLRASITKGLPPAVLPEGERAATAVPRVVARSVDASRISPAISAAPVVQAASWLPTWPLPVGHSRASSTPARAVCTASASVADGEVASSRAPHSATGLSASRAVSSSGVDTMIEMDGVVGATLEHNNLEGEFEGPWHLAAQASASHEGYLELLEYNRRQIRGRRR